MAFRPKDVAKLLVDCHRRCCICHRFCGTKIETDHMQPTAEGGEQDIKNAIAVCFECHAEIHSYNDNHPRGRKFRPEELKMHRDQWLKICKERPETLLSAGWDGDVGPIQALVDELEFNHSVFEEYELKKQHGALFHNLQFQRAIREGVISVLKDSLKEAVLKAYVAISRANQHIAAEVNQDTKEAAQGRHLENVGASLKDLGLKIAAARSELASFLTSESK